MRFVFSLTGARGQCCNCYPFFLNGYLFIYQKSLFRWVCCCEAENNRNKTFVNCYILLYLKMIRSSIGGGGGVHFALLWPHPVFSGTIRWQSGETVCALNSCLVADLFFISLTSSHNYFPSLGSTTIEVCSLCVWDEVQEGVIVHYWIDCPLITPCVWSMRVKAIDYFNPPYLWVCDPHSSAFDRGITNGPQRSLSQTSPCPINFQLESARK